MLNILRRPRPALRALRGDDEGSSLILVLGLGTVMTLLLAGLSGYAIQGYKTSKERSDWTSAIAAAQAGVDDYVSRVNDDELYWTKANTDSTNAALSGWTAVPGAHNGAQYRYTVNVSTTGVDGLVRLSSSGKVGTEVRTVSTTLRKGRFFDFVYFSDFETGDPANPLFYSSSYWNSKDEAAICGRYNWAGGYNTRDSNCPRIYWRNDEVAGKFHSNDTFFVSGSPRFNGAVSSGCPVIQSSDPCRSNTVYIKENSSANPVFAQTPRGGTILPMPASNSELRREADASQGGQGCLYTGPTRIVLKNNGRMAVDSPSTTSVPACGIGANASLPANGVIYIQSIPSAVKNPKTCTTGKPWVTTPAGVSLDSTSGGTSYPLSNDRTAWDCRAGDLFIEGTLKGQLTIATENDIIATGNLKYANGNTGADIIGLIAQNNVSLYHPVKSDGSEILGSSSMKDPEIWGALLSVAHSFNVQNYNAGTTKGTMTVRGSIAQKWRGAVGTFSGTTSKTGYSKDWAYDSRLAYLSPPKFLAPVAAAWVVGETAESAPIAP